MSLTKEDLAILSKPFPDDIIGVKVNNFNKERTKALLIQYLQHTDVYNRLEEVDPAWSCETGQPQFIDKTIAIPMKMTVKGVTRENVGEGADYKSAYSDAIKRAAMLFGVGRYLYDAQQVWVPYNEQTDKYKKWTIQEFRNISPKKTSDQMQKDLAQKVLSDKIDESEMIVNGKYKGRGLTIRQAFTLDAASNHGYAQYLKELSIKKGLSYLSGDLRRFLGFVEQQGVKLD